MENDELEANVIVVDDDVQATWLELVPGQHQLPQPAPPHGMSIEERHHRCRILRSRF